MISLDLPRPARVLAIGAHADDIEFGCGATLAKWAAAGTEVHLCVCTDGSKGTWDPLADLTELVATRVAEQHAAADALGARGVHLLGFVDGELTHDLPVRAALCRVIRESRPDVVLGHDPWRARRVHPDHGHAGQATLDGIVAARDPHFFPEQGLAAHRPQTLLCFEPARVDHVETVSGFVDRKVDALLAHRSQWRSTMHITNEAEHGAFVARIHAEARAAGINAGVRAAEAFSRLDAL
ncbi:MAG TPA: PIG-L deacetylase family protein [Acidimicrobiia bacterium]|nr:PIG-L deacetylase family protein [Acidimicrobiia bacterium]